MTKAYSASHSRPPWEKLDAIAEIHLNCGDNYYKTHMIFCDVPEFVNETLTTASLARKERGPCVKCDGPALWIKPNLHNRALQTEETVSNLNCIFLAL